MASRPSLEMCLRSLFSEKLVHGGRKMTSDQVCSRERSETFQKEAWKGKT